MVTDTLPAFTMVGAPYLEYLPVVDLSTGRLLGLEALVRWEHPTKGRIAPDALIPEAEASGDIGPLTRWVLMEACEQARHWSPSIQLGANCTVQQLRRGEVSEAVHAALEQSGLHSGQLTLEITEDAVIDSSAAADLLALSAMGVQLSVDDVGTNWSSFEPFRRHSISTVKIDGSFIAGLEPSQGINRLVVETVIHMAHSLGMSAIVECVETVSQVEIVRSFNADAAQGFFFAPPMSSESVAALVGSHEIPQFSRTERRTIVVPEDGSIDLDVLVAGTPRADTELDVRRDAALSDVEVDADADADADDDTVPEGTDTVGDTVDEGTVEVGEVNAATDAPGSDAEQVGD